MPKVNITDGKGLVQSSGSGTIINNALEIKGSLNLGATSVAGAGTAIGDAAALLNVGLNIVTGGNGTVGVQLPILTSVPTGAVYIVVNNATGALKVYPNAADQINGLGDGAVHAIAAHGIAIYINGGGGSFWNGAEPAVGA